MKVYREDEVQHHSFFGYLQIRLSLSYETRTEVHIIIIIIIIITIIIIIGSTALRGPWPPRSSYITIN